MSYVDEFLKRTLRVDRLSEGEAIVANAKISKLKDVIETELIKLDRIGNTPLNMAIAKNNIADAIRKTFADISVDAEIMSKKFIESEVSFTTDIFEIYSSKKITQAYSDIAFDRVYNRPFQGKTFSEWYSASSKIAQNKVRKAIESGFISGETTDVVTNKVATILNKSKADVKTLVRSNLLSASNEVRELSVDANKEYFEYKIWLSTLDARTTPMICGVRDNLKYTLENEPIDHDLPWGGGPGSIHFNCRSAWIPKIKGVPITGERPAISAGENYQQGDKTTNRGTVRKPTKANRDNGIFKIEQKGIRGKYEGWLRTQPTDFVADALGSREKAEAFKKGKHLSELTSRPFGQPLTIDKL